MDDDAPREGNISPRSLWRDVVGLAAGLSVIIGMLISVSQLVEYVSNAKRADLSQRLTSLAQVKDFLQTDEVVRRRGKQFLAHTWPGVRGQIAQRIQAATSGEDFYLSPELEDFAAVHYHYEQMGALVKLGYVEFPLIYEIVAFPDDYMDETEPLRAAIAANWKGMGKPLPDFGANIAYLRRCYDWSRRAAGKEPTCPPD